MKKILFPGAELPPGFTWRPYPDLGILPGIRVGSARAALKEAGDDTTVFVLGRGTRVAALFTRNRAAAAPVQLAREHRASHSSRLLLINSGNANAGTGKPGRKDAFRCCQEVAATHGFVAQEVLPFSTGPIGQRLPVADVVAAARRALKGAEETGWAAAARAICTTDRFPKGITARLRLPRGGVLRFTAIAKGAGMLCPDMATMLAFIATDAALPPHILRSCLRAAVEGSFNRISVDGDTSTNDACVLLATGRAAGLAPAKNPLELELLQRAFLLICRYLAQQMLRDAEGCSRVLGVTVSGGRHSRECLRMAYTIASSPLVKTSLQVLVPSPGRILAAIGRAALPALDVSLVQVDLGPLTLIRNGVVLPQTKKSRAPALTDRLLVRLGRGPARETVWTTDLTSAYVDFNAGSLSQASSLS